MEEQIKELAKDMPLRFVRKSIHKNLKVRYLAGQITKREYKSAKKKLKVIIRGL